MTHAADRADRLRKARDSAAKELGLPADDLRTKRFALLACEHEDLTAAYLAGERVYEDITKLEVAMAEVKATLPPAPIPVDIKFFGYKAFECEHCGEVNEAQVFHGKKGLRDAMKRDRESAFKDDAVAGEEVACRVTAPAPETQPTPSVLSHSAASKPVEPRPYHETIQKDTRPNAPPSGLANNGSVAWWSGSRA